MSGKLPALMVVQSGGPTAVLNASLAGVVESALASAQVGDILGARFGLEGLLAENYVNLRRQPPGIWQAIKQTPSAALGSCRRKLRAGEETQVLDSLQRLNVRYLVYIGGNDSADTSLALDHAARAAGYDLRVVAVPKTIDNDLPLTDHCPGYGSAARYLAQSTQDAGLDTEAMRLSDPIKLIEVMGRDAGWLVAACSLGRESEDQAPHVLCVPERPLDVDAFIGAIDAAYCRFGYAVAVVAETARDMQGRPLGGLNDVAGHDAFGHPTLQGTADALAAAVGRALGRKTRFDKPGTLQRMSGALLSPVDIQEAWDAGAAGVHLALEGVSGRMITLLRQAGLEYHCTFGHVRVDGVANRHRVLPPEYLGDDPFYVSEAFRQYARPLIGPPLLPYARLRD